MTLSGLDADLPYVAAHAFPPLCDGQVMQFPHSLRRAATSVSSPLGLHSDAPGSALIDIQMATANVLALDVQEPTKEFGRRVGARTQRLDAQWHARKIHLVGVQEAVRQKGS